MNLEEYETNLEAWKNKNRFARSYVHFDSRITLDKVYSYIIDTNNISQHGFYPFIHYSLEHKRYRKKGEKKQKDPKKREICYASHLDRYIYSYYSFMLNQYYNEYLATCGLDMVAVAYRDSFRDKRKKCNIHFAKDAFDKIRNLKESYVIIGDFTDFFSSLDL